MKYCVIFFVLIGFVGISLTMSQVFGFEPAMNQAPLSYFGYFDEHGNKLTKLVVGEEYYIKAKFFWPESYSQPYEFFAEINDDKNYIVIERFTTSGIMTPNSELEVSFSWTPKEEGRFRNFSELWATDGSTVITGVPQYDFEVVSSTDNASQRISGGSFSPDKTVYPVPWDTRPPLKQFKDGIDLMMIHCNDKLVLIFKHNGSPACVKPTTAEKLIERGWGFYNNLLTLIEKSDRIITGMVTDVLKYENGRREVFLGVYEWLKKGTNLGAFLELDDTKNKETARVNFKRGEEVLLFLKDIDESRGARDLFYTEKILPAKYPISLRDKVFSLVNPEERGTQTKYQYDENCSKKDLFGDSYMYCTYAEKEAMFYVPIEVTSELVREKLLEHVSEKYFQEHFDLIRSYDQAAVNGHITPYGQVLEFQYNFDYQSFLYLIELTLSNSEVYLYYVPPREINSLQYAEKMNELTHSCFEPDTIIVFWDKVVLPHIENGFSPAITGAGPPEVRDRYGNMMQNYEKHFRFWPETGEIECSQGMQELPNKIKRQERELFIDTTQFLKFKTQK